MGFMNPGLGLKLPHYVNDAGQDGMHTTFNNLCSVAVVCQCARAPGLNACIHSAGRAVE